MGSGADGAVENDRTSRGILTSPSSVAGFSTPFAVRDAEQPAQLGTFWCRFPASPKEADHHIRMTDPDRESPWRNRRSQSVELQMQGHPINIR